jgi:hypothetical protein
MSSRASGISLVRRLCISGRVSRAETEHCTTNAILTFGIPDKMAARSAAHSPSRAVASVSDRFECRRHVSRASWRALVTEPHSRWKCTFRVIQAQCLRCDGDNSRDSTPPLYGSTGETTGLLETPLLLCTATSRGKDDHHRGPFLHAGGEIYFWWSEFWTERREELLVIRPESWVSVRETVVGANHQSTARDVEAHFPSTGGGYCSLAYSALGLLQDGDAGGFTGKSRSSA